MLRRFFLSTGFFALAMLIGGGALARSVKLKCSPLPRWPGPDPRMTEFGPAADDFATEVDGRLLVARGPKPAKSAWVFDAHKNTWVRVNPTAAPERGRLVPAGAYLLAGDGVDRRFWDARKNRWHTINPPWAVGLSTFVGPNAVLSLPPQRKLPSFAKAVLFFPRRKRVRLVPSTLSPREAQVLAFKHYFVTWGGRSSTSPFAHLDDGAILDVRNGRWRAIARKGAPSARVPDAALLTKSGKLVAWGGVGPAGVLADGAVLDLRKNRWRAISTDGAPEPRRLSVTFIDGDLLYVLGGLDKAHKQLTDGGVYNLRTHKWRKIAATPEVRSSLLSRVHKTIGGRIILAAADLSVLYRFDANDQSFVRLDGREALVRWSTSRFVFSGDELVAWGTRSRQVDPGSSCPPYSGSGPVCDPSPPRYEKMPSGIRCKLD